MKIYVAPSLEVLTDVEDVACLDLLMRRSDPVGFIPYFLSYIDCL